ncbi:MAG: Ribosomal protein S12 methylthiotransferase RimO [Candidatus Woesearchaeota archaeon]|nr:Ribosomal protein S12 methylthiotransferase RimO [Candidatus Woesearchaeota archaeon]
MRILLTDMPWRGKKYAGRAGMRWAHTSDKAPVVSFRPFPFFLGCTAAVLEKQGHNVKVIDALSEKLSEKRFLSKVSDFDPDCVLAEIHTPSYSNDQYFASKVKKITDCKFVFAGPHATSLPKQVLADNSDVDFVLAGEYEFLMRDLVQKNPSKKILRLKKPPDINKIPWPARHLFNMELYNEVFCRNYPNVQLMASRGCFYRCTYCNIHLMNACRKHRPRDPKDVVDEIEYVIEKYNPKELYFDDDTINGSPKVLEKWLDLKIKRRIDIPFTGMGHVNISKTLLRKMKKANCVGLKFGIESADNKVLKRLGKGMTIEMAKKTINLCKELGIRTHLTYAIGLPGATEKTIEKTIKFAKSYGDQYQISMAAPFPGTELYKEAKQKGWLGFSDWDELDGMKNAVINYPNLSSKKITQLYNKGQSSTYNKLLKEGEWLKYIKMIYQEHGLKGIFKLVFVRGPGLAKEVLSK